MTTILYRNGILFADSQTSMVTSCSTCKKSVSKVHSTTSSKIKVVKPFKFEGDEISFVVSAGRISFSTAMLKLLQEGVDSADKIKGFTDVVWELDSGSLKDVSIEMLLVGKKNNFILRFSYKNVSCKKFDKKQTLSLGTGRGYVDAVLNFFGGDSLLGMLLAVKMDEASGGNIAHVNTRSVGKKVISRSVEYYQTLYQDKLDKIKEILKETK